MWTKTSLSVSIFVPGYFVIIKRSRKHIHIAISVYIGCVDPICSNCICCNNLLWTKTSLSVSIFVPGYFIIIIRSRKYIHIAISVYIGGINGSCSIYICCNDLLWTKTPLSVSIFIPGYFIIIKRSRKHIHIAISVYIGGVNWKCAICICCYNLLWTKITLSVSIFVPGYFIIIKRSRKHIHIAISIYIGGVNGSCIICICCYNLLWTKITLSVGIFIPGYFIIILRSRKHIHIAISIYIYGVNWYCFICVCCNNLLWTKITLSVGIFIPGYFIIILRSWKRIHIAISVYICGVNRCCLICICCYNLLWTKLSVGVYIN